MGVIAVRPKIPYQISTAAIAAALAAVTFTASPAAAEDPVTKACATVESIFARGSGQETFDPESRRFETQIRARIASPSTLNQYELGTQTIDGHSYPAVPVGTDKGFESIWNTIGAGITGGGGLAYGDSVNTGVDELAAYLTKRAAACPDAHFVLGGYSQGAQVVGEAFNEKLSDNLRGRIVYQALFGDPKLWLPEGEGFLPGTMQSPASIYRKTPSGGSTFPTAGSHRVLCSPESLTYQPAFPQLLDYPAPVMTSSAVRAGSSGITKAI